MIGLFGLIKHELIKQDKLPLKYYEIPENPNTSNCVLYIDAINNNGGSHSNDINTWIPIIGSKNGTKAGSSVWKDDCLETSNSGYHFGKLPQSQLSEFTVEIVIMKFAESNSTRTLFSCAESGGFHLYQSAADNNLYFRIYSASSKEYEYVSVSSDPYFLLNTKSYIAVRFNQGKVLWNSVNSQHLDTVKSSVCSYTTEAPLAVGYEPDETGAVQYPERSSSFRIYSMRFHTKALSDEEIKSNILYERNRYNF